MHAPQVITRPREVRLIGLVQLAPCYSPFSTPGIRGPEQMEFVWHRCRLDSIDDTLDLVFISAMRAPVGAVHRALAKLRTLGWTKPVLVWIDRTQLSATPRFVTAGATDFILTDTHPDEAASRLHAALLRAAPPEAAPEPAPGVTLDWKQRAVLMGDMRVRLTMREMQLLDVMLQTREPLESVALAHKAWGRIPSEGSNLVSVCVCNLRRKLARFGSAFGIRTHRGAGYSVQVRRD